MKSAQHGFEYSTVQLQTIAEMNTYVRSTSADQICAIGVTNNTVV